MRYSDDALEVDVTDAGGGPRARRDGGHGLVGMRERVGIFGGTFDAGPSDAGGFAVRALLPLEVSA